MSEVIETVTVERSRLTPGWVYLACGALLYLVFGPRALGWSL